MRAISGKENKVKEYIDAEIKNSDLGDYVAQVLIPTEKVYSVRAGKKITKERSYLPGYVLIEANLSGEIQHRLRNTPNVIGFLEHKEREIGIDGKELNTFKSVPTPMRQSEVNQILGVVDELQESGEELLTPFYVNENVKVISGPFSGFNGTIEEVNNEKRKLKVMVMIFGRKNPVELSFTQVEKE
ncbi:MAG: transcription termination/antitermination factor NusG [Porphyromonadaceae bacterium]|jgi:transcriptional antiterminator NusG|nr:transcription termination/antitermination factor NusG [Porphyromonadaceae bacterium]